MCGIYGVFGNKLKKINNYAAFKALEHRGPDDFHTIEDNENGLFTLSAVRLAFQDLEHGRQPLIHKIDGKSIIVSLNGEIYNHIDLRKKLIKDDFKFKSKCDTESMLSLYLKYGIDFVKYLRGMYAISIWDGRFNKGFLINDYLSQKPIFYILKNNNLFFSSELGSLICLISEKKKKAQSKREINNDSLLDILSFNCVIKGETIYKEIKRLRPCQILEFNVDLNFLKVKNPSRFNNIVSTKKDISEEEASEKIKDLLRNAIEKRVDINVPQSLYLSGGVDSSLIACILGELYPKIEINTFNLGYQGNSVDQGKQLDSKMARYISKKIKSRHHQILVDPENLSESLNSIIKCYGEPFSAAPSMWFVAKEISKFSKYSLSGDGADELFGSYYTHRMSALKKPKNLFECLEIYSEYNQSFLEGIFKNEKEINLKNNLFKLSKEFNANELNPDKPILNQLLVESNLFFPYKFITYIDRLSMSHSVEPRSPFLDKDLWEYVINLPDSFRIRNGETKYILKKIANEYLPNEIVYRKKEGFVFPLYPYLIKDEELIFKRIKNFLDSDITILSTLINEEWLKICFSEIKKGRYSEYKKSLVVHTLNVISIWFKEFY